MSETSGFFNAQLVDETPDRVYEASDFAGYYASLIGDGVFANPSTNLQVVASATGLAVVLKSGKAFIKGYWYNLTEDTTITLDSGTAGTTRYDAVVLELNLSSRHIIFKLLKGVATGTYPSSNSFLTRNDNVYQVCLAIIAVSSSGTSSFTRMYARNITDTRPDNRYCGWVTGLVQQITTTGLFSQYNDAFNDWFDSVKDILDETDVYELQTQINSIIQLLDSGITTLRELNTGAGFRIWIGTTAEYESLVQAGQVLTNVLYLKTDDTSAADIRSMLSSLSTAVGGITSQLDNFAVKVHSTGTGSSAIINCAANSTFTSGALNTPFESESEIANWTPIIRMKVESGVNVPNGFYWSYFIRGNKLFIHGNNPGNYAVAAKFEKITWIKNIS